MGGGLLNPSGGGRLYSMLFLLLTKRKFQRYPKRGWRFIFVGSFGIVQARKLIENNIIINYFSGGEGFYIHYVHYVHYVQ